MKKQVVLEVKNLTKIFNNGRVAVNNITFSISAGEIFGFLGANGAGKSTAIKMITGLSKITEGSVKICGKSIKSQFEEAIKNVGGIVETPEMYKHMSGMTNLKYYASLYSGIRTSRIREVVRLVGMENRINEKVGKYSLGMKQRVGIAQAILHNPKLLILDEPTNGLDPNGIKEMREFLKDLAHKENIAIMISSHILAEMEQLCDTIGIIDNGVMLKISPIEEIRKGIESSQKIVIRVDYPNYAGKLIINQFKANVELENNTIVAALPDSNIPKIVAFLISKGISVYGILQKTKSLEEVFLEMIKKHSAGTNIK